MAITMRTPGGVLQGRRRGRGLAAWVALAGAAALVVGAGLVVGGRVGEPSHQHAAVATAAHPAAPGVTWERLREIDTMLSTAQTATERYRDVAVAEAAGYVRVTPFTYNLGAHYINPEIYAEHRFDLTRPPFLLYAYGAAGALDLVGVAWALPLGSVDEVPPADFAPLGMWHDHIFADACVGADAGVIQVSGEAACRAAGAAFIPGRMWMVHAWLFRPSPDGVFAVGNGTID